MPGAAPANLRSNSTSVAVHNNAHPETLPANCWACGLCSAGLTCSEAAPTKAVTAGREAGFPPAAATPTAGLPAVQSSSFGSGTSHSCARRKAWRSMPREEGARHWVKGVQTLAPNVPEPAFVMHDVLCISPPATERLSS